MEAPITDIPDALKQLNAKYLQTPGAKTAARLVLSVYTENIPGVHRAVEVPVIDANGDDATIVIRDPRVARVESSNGEIFIYGETLPEKEYLKMNFF